MIRRCLVKDPQLRLRDIGEARIALMELAKGEVEEPVAAPAPAPVAPRSRQSTLFWLLGLLIAAGAASAVTWNLRPAAPRMPVRRFLMSIKDLEASYRQSPSLSPDGRRIAYSSGGRLWIRDLDLLKPREIPGSEGARVPFWSPDGSLLAYVTGGKLWKMPASGGQPAAICDLATSVDGGTWGPGDAIVLAPSTGALIQVSARGGDSRPILEPDAAKETDFHKPWFLPEGRGIIFIVHRAEGPDTMALLSGKVRKTLMQVAGARLDNPSYSPTGHIVYSREGSNAGVWAVPFSLEKLDLAGEPFLIDPDGGLPSQSKDGTLALVPGAGHGLTQMVWLDRSGKILEPIGQPQREIFTPRLSPEGRRVAVSADENNNRDIWIHDIARQTRTRLTFDPSIDLMEVWSPQGDRVYFGDGGAAGGGSIKSAAADGTGQVKVLGKGDITALSPDGKLLAYSVRDVKTKDDLWVTGLEEGAKPVPLLQTPAREWGPAISPDGHYVAYMSDESGRPEIYLTRFPAGGGKWQVSVDGGMTPVWARKSGELFFRNTDGLMVVPVATQPALTLGQPKELFNAGAAKILLGPGRRYDVDPEGRRILAVQSVGGAEVETGITIVENWLGPFGKKP
jgi:Tol biopolymer transport system component